VEDLEVVLDGLVVEVELLPYLVGVEGLVVDEFDDLEPVKPALWCRRAGTSGAA